MSQKKYVARGQFQGETALVQKELDDGKVLVQLADFHTMKPISDECIPISKGDLEDM